MSVAAVRRACGRFFRATRIFKSVLVIAMLGAAALAGNRAAVWLVRGALLPKPAKEALFVEPADLNFGEVWEDSNFHWTLPIHNQTDHEIAIDEFSTSCHCMVVEPKSLTLPPHGSAEMQLVLDLSPFTAKEARSNERDFDVRFLPRLPAGMVASNGWTIHGRVRSTMLVDPPVLNLGRHSCLQQEQPLGPSRIKVFGLERLDGIDVSTDDPGLRLSTKRTSSDPDVFEIVAFRNQTGSIGPITAKLFVRAILPTAECSAPKTVRVVGRIVEDIEALPATIVFGAHQVGESVETTTTFHSLSGRRFRLQSFEVDSSDLAVTSLESGAEPAVRITQKITKKGDSSSNLTFHFVDEDDRPQSVCLAAQYFGIAAR